MSRILSTPFLSICLFSLLKASCVSGAAFVSSSSATSAAAPAMKTSSMHSTASSSMMMKLQSKDKTSTSTSTSTTTSLNLFGKMFEEEGPLGKGITVGKFSVALTTRDRSATSIVSMVASAARRAGSESPELAELTETVCLALLRRSDDWVGACSSSQWFSGDDAGKAESAYNDLANREAAKFEKEYIPGAGSEHEKPGGPTTVVVSMVLEIQGDATKFDGAGYSIEGTRDVLSSIAADCKVDEGYCMNAAELFWCPSEKDEVLSNTDVIVDFPELISM